MLESDIERRLVKGVFALGGRAYKFVSPANRGVADRVVVWPGGRVWFVEIKTTRGKLTPLQQMFQQEVQDLGANYVCLHGAEDVDHWLAEPQHKPLTIERLRDALVASRIIPPAAVEDPDEYDDGVTLFRIEALHRRIT